MQKDYFQKHGGNNVKRRNIILCDKNRYNYKNVAKYDIKNTHQRPISPD